MKKIILITGASAGMGKEMANHQHHFTSIGGKMAMPLGGWYHVK